MNYGFRVVISSRFADIFRGNSGKQGLLTASGTPGGRRADLEGARDRSGRAGHRGSGLQDHQRSQAPRWPLKLDDYTRWRLLEGLDDIGLTLRHEAEVTSFEAKRRRTCRPRWRSEAPSGAESRADTKEFSQG